MDIPKNKGGRKKKSDDQKKKLHPVYATDKEWGEIVKKAESENMEVSPYVIKKALE